MHLVDEEEIDTTGCDGESVGTPTIYPKEAYYLHFEYPKKIEIFFKKRGVLSKKNVGQTSEQIMARTELVA